MNSKHKGEISEAVVISEFLKLGIPVSKPFGDNQPYDLIIDVEGILKKIQVKTGRLRDGVVVYNTIATTNTYIKKYVKNSNRSYKGKIDFIAIYCPINNRCYLVSIDECVKTAGSLRVDKTINSQIKNIKWAHNYVLSHSLVVKHFPDKKEIASPILAVTTTNVKKTCVCGNKKNINAIVCLACYLKTTKRKRRHKRPKYEILRKHVEANGYSATGRKYSVSDNSIRKWLNEYEKELGIIDK
jgi:hypothetical protein